MSEHDHYAGTNADRCEVCGVELIAPDYKALATDALRALREHDTSFDTCYACNELLNRPEARALLEPGA